MERYFDAKLLLSNDVHDRIRKSKVLVFGAGGIGCELLKNLVLVGFENIHVVDMDTVDVSNLNRQFLFRNSDVGKPKSEVAAAKVKMFNPQADVKFYHQNLFEFGLDFYEKFDICINGLDNIDARKQVNRMCLLVGNLPMIDGGTQGYDGQVMTTHRGRTECYECQPKNPPKSYPVCTIRSNPSKLVHCVVWGKHLYNRLFGAQEEDSEFLKEISEIMDSPDDPSSTGSTSKGERMFKKVFNEDIKKLIEMKKDKKWDRGAPIPLLVPETMKSEEMEEQSIPDLPLLIQSFYLTLPSLKKKCQETGTPLKFDKDDDESMRFVFAVSNLRAMNFRIPVQSYFDVKAIAGSIIPAIATSNAIIAGLQVFEAIKILSRPNRTELLGKKEGEGTTTIPFPTPTEKSSYLRRVPSTYKRKWKCLILGMGHSSPSRKCYVCQSNEMCIRLYLQGMSIGSFVDLILMKELGMKDPWIVFDGNGIYESGMGEDEDDDEEGEGESHFDMSKHRKKKMSEFGIVHGSQITATCMEIEKMYWKITFIEQQQFEDEGEDKKKKMMNDEDDIEEEEEADVLEKKEKWYKISSKQQGDEEMEEKRKMRDEDESDSSDIVCVVTKEDDEEDVVIVENPSNADEERKRKRDDGGGVVGTEEESEKKKRKIDSKLSEGIEDDEDDEDEDVILE